MMVEAPHQLNEADDIVFLDRCEPRSATNWIAMIRLLDGAEVPCTVKDVSRSGAKLGVPSRVALPATFMMKVLGRDLVYLVKLAWRNGNYAGVHFERIGKLTATDRKPAIEATPAPPPVDSCPHIENRPRKSKISSF